MKYRFLIIFTVICALFAEKLHARGDINYVLGRVEEFNKDLAAHRQFTDARKLEAKTGIYLSNPSIEYERLWGSGSPAAGIGELNVSQAFDFPTVYADRSKISKLKQSMYDSEGAVFRRQLLLDAKLLCIEIIYLRKLDGILGEKLSNAKSIAQAYKAKLDAGDANIIECNRAEMEYINARADVEMNLAGLAAVTEQLNNMAGGNEVELFSQDYGVEYALPSFEELCDVFLQNNPELQNLRDELDVSRRNVALSRSLSLPSFEVGYRRDFGEGTRFNGFSAGISIPLFENKNAVKTAKAQASYTEKRLESARQNNMAQLRQLYNQALILRSSVEMLRETVDTRNNIALLDKALNAGQISVIDYFTEAASVYANKMSLLDTERRYHEIMAQLFRFEL